MAIIATYLRASVAPSRYGSKVQKLHQKFLSETDDNPKKALAPAP